MLPGYRRSLNRRIRNIVLTVVGICLSLAFFVFFLFEQNNFQRSFSREIDNLTTIIARYSAPILAFNDEREARASLQVLVADFRVVRAKLSDTKGRALAIYNRKADVQQILDSDLLQITKRIEDHGQYLGDLTLWLDTSFQHQLLIKMLLTLSLLGLFCIALAWALSRRLPESITRSVTRLVEVFDEIRDSMNYRQRAPYTDLVELDALVQGFNFMLEEVGNRDEQLRQSRENLELALKGSGEGLWYCDLAQGFLFSDERCHQILGCDAHQEGNRIRSWLRLIHPKDRHQLVLALRNHFRGKTPSFELECRLSCVNGGYRWVILHGMTVKTDSGKPQRISGTMMDNNERHQAMEESKLLAAVFQNTHEPVVVVNTELMVQAANQAFTDRYRADQPQGAHLETALDGAYDSQFYQSLIKKLKDDKFWEGEVRLLNPKGGMQVMWLSLVAVGGTDDENYLGTFTRIEQRQTIEDELRYLANYDPLTSLPNRRMFNERLQHSLSLALRHSNRFAIFFLDLNDFKSINDTLGHNIGDELLIEVARRLQRAMRDADTVARLGGDEFVVLAEHCGGKQEIECIANRLLEVFSSSILCNEHQIHTGASIGIASFPEDGNSLESLMINADLAMYQAKLLGQNHYSFFKYELAQKAEKNARLKAELAYAIERNQLYITLQPKFNLESMQLHSAEVLLRWEHPLFGLVPPLEFIPIAEESGFIEAIGEWVMTQTAAQLKAWKGGALAHIKLAVNVSVSQFNERTLPDLVQRLRMEYEIPENHLELEITESLLLSSGASSENVLRLLKKEGVNISIDDFGTGYSSLQYLSKFPVDYLKIDRSFVSDLVSETRNKTIVRAILAMAHGLNMEVIAEGIETDAQLQMLKEMGCKYGQGYWCSPPLVIEKFESFVAQWQQGVVGKKMGKS